MRIDSSADKDVALLPPRILRVAVNAERRELRWIEGDGRDSGGPPNFSYVECTKGHAGLNGARGNPMDASFWVFDEGSFYCVLLQGDTPYLTLHNDDGDLTYYNGYVTRRYARRPRPAVSSVAP